MSRFRNRFASTQCYLVQLVATAFLLICCGSDAEVVDLSLASDGRLQVQVVIPLDSGPGLRLAADDLVEAMASIAGVPIPSNAVVTSAQSGMPTARVHLDEGASAEFGDQGFSLTSDAEGIVVLAATEQGASYGLWSLAQELGASWFHPEQSFYPRRVDARLPDTYDGIPEVPRFDRRGFHEHTQHPIVASDFMLRPGDDERRAMASRYVRWLARNRQNVMSFHMLRTVELESWIPYIAGITAEASDLFIDSGVVIGFVDEQQNGFKCYRPESDDRPAQVQINERVDSVLEGGFDFLTFQIGASEFTKPSDEELLGWMHGTLEHVNSEHPGVRLGTWVHITCDLEADDGGLFFHLPLQSDTAWRAWVHTTMFYTLSSPAPVYDCETFGHQTDFIEAARETGRELDYFPETAWWLGFDINVPLALPIYGWSRDRDIRESLDERTTGHVTFTSGREWGYWRYDHYLTRATWEGDLSWEQYLSDLSPLFGESGGAMSRALEELGSLQVQHFYEDDPLLFFYVAGELPQDEIGVIAGIVARRPKRSFSEILSLSDEAFATWQSNDLDALRAMYVEYSALLEPLPEESGGDELQAALFGEARDGLELFVLRLEHVIRLYEGVVAARAWQEAAAADPQETEAMESARAEADSALDDAEAISQLAIAIVGDGELRYRYPLSLLAEPKPESPTIYPFGSVAETSTGYFWTRRDDQLAALLLTAFSAAEEEWEDGSPEAVFFVLPGEIAVVVPENPLASVALTAFLPGLVFGLPAAPPEGALAIRVSQDRNGNQLPDPGFEQSIEGELDAETWTNPPAELLLAVYDDTEALVSMITVHDAVFDVEVSRAPNDSLILGAGSLVGTIDSAAIVTAISSITGTGLASSEELVKQVYDIAGDDTLPNQLPLEVSFEFSAGD